MFLKPFFRMPDNGALLQMALERHCWKVAGNRIQRAGVKMQAGSILQKTDQNSPAVPVDCNIFALPVKPKKVFSWPTTGPLQIGQLDVRQAGP